MMGREDLAHIANKVTTYTQRVAHHAGLAIVFRHIVR
jgi:hypothetical protein